MAGDGRERERERERERFPLFRERTKPIQSKNHNYANENSYVP